MAERLLYVECYSGISGDMFLGALLDLGADPVHLRKELDKLKVDGYELSFGRTQKCGVSAYAFHVQVEGEEEMPQDHRHGHHHGHSHEHRTYRDIRDMIETSELSLGVKERSLKIFGILAEAEGKVHGKPKDEVAFHEVGAVDSIVDIVGAAICMEDLGIGGLILSSMYEGRGHVWCQHGKIPVPVPAVAQLWMKHDLPLHLTEVEGEMITPTGAAIAAACRREENINDYRKLGMGIGAGKKDFPHANILRVILLEKETEEMKPGESVWVLETNIDDCSGETAGHTIELLMKAGALDASCFPCMMKKRRPGYMLQVIAGEGQEKLMEDIILHNTTTIGLRKYQERRRILSRQIETIDTPYGSVRRKVCVHKGMEFHYPEYEDVSRIAEETGMSYGEVYGKLSREEI